VRRNHSGRLLLHIRLIEPDGKYAPIVVPGNNRFALAKPHCGVASAGRGANVTIATSPDATSSGRIRRFFN
jgi:hypothetical protein